MGLIPRAMRPPAASRAGRLHVVRGQGHRDRQTDSLPVCQEQPQMMWPEQGPPAGALTGAPQNPRTGDYGGTLLGWFSLQISVQLLLTLSSTELEWLLAPSSYWILRHSCENP